MFQKLEAVESRFEQVQLLLQKPDIATDQKHFRELMKELSQLEEVVRVFRRHKKLRSDLKASLELLQSENDAELRQLAKEDLKILQAEQEELEKRLQILLLPKDPNDDKNVLLEIRAGAGGDEASIFAEELFRAYTHYAQKRSWRVELLSHSAGNVGGSKEIIASISGEKVFSRLKFESGVHRVQRVPQTEASGRVHTSTVTVAVIPEQEASEVKINPQELRIDVTRSQGSGGQSVNTTDSAVRVTHLPTGIIVFCQVGKSQLSNKEMALRILYSRLVAIEEEKRRKEASEARLAQIGTGDRSERIRTYNFPQSRVTDHRIGLTTHQISEVMHGGFDELIEALVVNHQAEVLKASSGEA
ncbi:MAG: peptide chain release factor 1 [Bdellovibrio sp.]